MGIISKIGKSLSSALSKIGIEVRLTDVVSSTPDTVTEKADTLGGDTAGDCLKTSTSFCENRVEQRVCRMPRNIEALGSVESVRSTIYNKRHANPVPRHDDSDSVPST